VSRQAFPRKIGQKVRGVSETHGYHNVTHATAMSHMHATCESTKKWKTCKHMSVILYVRLHMQQNGWLNPEFYDMVVKFWIQSSDLSVQASFPNKK